MTISMAFAAPPSFRPWSSRTNAVLGVSDACIAVHPSDMAVAMRVLDATVETVGPSGKPRTIPIADLHRLPGSEPTRETILRPDEMITAVTLPRPVRGLHLYRKVRDRASYAFATVSIAAVLVRNGDRVSSGRVAFGGLAHKPWRVDAAEREWARGSDAVADIVLAGARTTSHNAYKLPLARRLVAAAVAVAGRG